MSTLGPEEVDAMLSASGLDPDDWDSAELAAMLEGQKVGIDSLREHLTQADEPALMFDPRWE
ncbi:MAG: hypothetical protein F4Z41_05205 [Acidimicrobiia bacterium]|nr:hypothetical protein [Acidimicrobiia bacterium]MXX45585.1 hypothetical protein [Acidimicrobiia bacterium]MXY75194.1 hypothetical protein [Acidimicrobiia bacterium]MYA38364.1 hypothetical protein [Acidimicrobiia bacterium]MYB78046.1 hypothetical protein [Acidimicrobiia bacterium]